MTLFKCLTLVALVAVLDAAKFKCEYTLYKDAGGYLKYQEIPLTFEDAKQRCASEGGVLASPIYYDGIKAAMMSVMKTSRVKSAVFTGFSDKSNHSAKFTSVEEKTQTQNKCKIKTKLYLKSSYHHPVESAQRKAGENGLMISEKNLNVFISFDVGMRLPEIPHTWALNEPKNCIVMLADGTISVVKCDEQYSHFCFINEMSALKLNACSLKYNDYELDSTTGSCYKFHRTKLHYDEAAMVCEKEGGHLLIINGHTEVQVVKNLYSKNPTSENGKYALIGFRFNKGLRKWMTLQGETLEEAGYEKWAPGEPNNAHNKQYCGAVYYTGALDDIYCDGEFPFICEKIPEILLCK